jgi:uracil-DNA glycosylase family 4
MLSPFDDLNNRIVSCQACPRLVEWRTRIAREKRAAFAEETYWGKAVPNFGDPDALGLILGLAPAAHGANRTGRMFTGDRSGDWLFRALHRAGLASQPEARHAQDGLELSGVIITASAHCAPPDNKPTKEELAACRGFLEDTARLRPWRTVLCLGSIAWDSALTLWPRSPRPKFGHGARSPQDESPMLLGSYHPSQQNTFTGRLTEDMLDEVVGDFARLIRGG